MTTYLLVGVAVILWIDARPGQTIYEIVREVAKGPPSIGVPEWAEVTLILLAVWVILAASWPLVLACVLWPDE